MTKLYVANLAYDATEEALRGLFAEDGTVQSAKLITDRGTGRSRGFAFVEMSPTDASRAIQILNGKDFQGRPLRVNEVQERSGGYRAAPRLSTNDRGPANQPWLDQHPNKNRLHAGNHALLSSEPSNHKPAALRTLFPALIQVRMELEFVRDIGQPPSGHVHILHPAAAASFSYPCPTGGCSGLFKLDMAVIALLQSSGRALTEEVTCGGVRPQDRITGKLCVSILKYKVEAMYCTPTSNVQQDVSERGETSNRS